MTESLAEHWENQYRERAGRWSGKVNATTAGVVEGLAPGSAIDLACGEGGDAVWLAQRGWSVTGVDISPTAVERARAAAAGLGGIEFVAADLGDWEPPAAVDLVTSSFMHSRVEFPRVDILRRAAGWVLPRGHLLVVTHAEAPPWSGLAHDHHHEFPTPQGDLDALALDPEAWTVVRAEILERHATGPAGEQGLLKDGVLLLHRR